MVKLPVAQQRGRQREQHAVRPEGRRRWTALRARSNDRSRGDHQRRNGSDAEKTARQPIAPPANVPSGTPNAVPAEEPPTVQRQQRRQ